MGAFVATGYFKTKILDDMLADVTSDDFEGILKPENVSVGLITSTGVITQDTALGDLTPATFGGYALTPMTSWGDVRRDNGGNYKIVGNSIAFDCTGPPNNETITGAYLVDNTTTPDKLLGVQMFDDPVLISMVGNGLNYSPEFSFAFDLTTGEGCLC